MNWVMRALYLLRLKKRPAPAPAPLPESPLVFGLQLDGNGGGMQLNEADIPKNWDAEGITWIHVDGAHPAAETFIQNISGLNNSATNYLLSEETRPGCLKMDDALMLILRSVNHENAEHFEDMLSVRFWIDPKHLISIRRRKSLIIEAAKDATLAGTGVQNAASFTHWVADAIVGDVAKLIESITVRLTYLETRVFKGKGADCREELNTLHIKLLQVKQFIHAQSTVFNNLHTAQVSWLNAPARLSLQSLNETNLREKEDFEILYQRTLMLLQEIYNQNNERLSTRMYVLAILTGIFLPISFVTGLFGMNVGGMPLLNDPKGFLYITGGLLGIGFVSFIIMRLRKWL